MFGGTGFGLFAGILYWFPKMFGRMYRNRVINTAFIFMFVGFNALYFPMLILGYMGNPRRYFDYVPEFQTWHVVSTVGSWILVTGLIIFIAHLVRSVRHGEPAPDNPWGGTTLEWTIPSPPPTENFEQLPEVTRGPYYHGGAA
jgi:cytochrome c oxidase subunit 1